MKYIRINETLEFPGGFTSDDSIISIGEVTESIRKTYKDGVFTVIGKDLNCQLRFHKDIEAYDDSKDPIYPSFGVDGGKRIDMSYMYYNVEGESTEQVILEKLLESIETAGFVGEILTK